MGTIIGHQTYLECDTLGCRERSTPMFDQDEAIKLAYRKGWNKNSEGHITCPTCKQYPTPTNQGVCTQKLSCRFQRFADKTMCGALTVIDCRHKDIQEYSNKESYHSVLED